MESDIHVLLISSGDSCVLTPRAEEERQTGKKICQFVIIASRVLENILALWGQPFNPIWGGRGK